VRTRRLGIIASCLLVAGLAAPASTAAAPESRVNTRSWTPLSASSGPNFAQAAVARTADGTQHVVWLVDDPAGTHNYEHTTISPTGVQGAVTRILTPSWGALSTPVDLGVNPDGSLRLAFRGNQTGNTADFFSYKGVYTAVSTDGGASWVVPREVLAPSISDGGVTMAFTPTGVPITGFGDTGGFHWYVGTIPEAAVPAAVVQEFTDHDAYAATLVTSGASVYVLYESIRGAGIFARQVWPTLGAPIRAQGEYTNPGQPMAVVDRPGVGLVAAYMRDNKAVLWDVTANSYHRVRGMDGASSVSLALESDGHMWIGSAGPIGYEPRVSRVAKRRWNIDRRPLMLDDMYNTFGVEISSANPLRAELLLTGNDVGDPSRIHAMSALAQMTVKATPRRVRVGGSQRVVFKVTDVDGGVRGVRVRAAGARCTTNSAGRCDIRLRGFSRPTRVRVKATKSSYVDAKTVIRVVRR
jgi:hypothetical protein